MALITQAEFARRKRERDTRGRIFYALCLAAVLVSLSMLGVLLSKIGLDGYSRVDWSFLTSFPSRHPEKAGILPALVGSVFVVGIAGVMSFVLGVAAAVYLEEYAQRSRFAQILRINIANLAGVPSVVYGLLGLEIFVRVMHLGPVILAGSFTLALLVLPLIIVASSEAIRAVPSSLREGGFGLGATRWQVVRNLVLPQAFPASSQGIILQWPGHGRDRASDFHRGADLRAICARQPPQRFHRDAHPDLQLDFASAAGIPRGGGGGHHRAAGVAAGDERPGCVPEKQVPKQTGLIATGLTPIGEL